MPCHILADCLSEIFEYLYDKPNLYSCLLVNHLWCNISVRILWRNIWKCDYPTKDSSEKILNTLIACLPNESKELLYENEIIIPTPTSKPPLFQLCNNLDCLKDLLKLKCSSTYVNGDWTSIIPDLKKHSNTLIKLHLSRINDNLSFSFVTLFPNLQEIKFTFHEAGFKDFDKLQYPKLQNLDISYPFHDKEESNTLRIIFDNCQYLESMKFYCGNKFLLSEKELLEIVVKHSTKNVCELKIFNISNSELLPEDLESFFISWKNRVSKKSLSLIIIKNEMMINSLEVNEENMKIIEKYKN
ncbi:hypothetical protein C1645_834415 [Glomus cerebriforme]|uniref:F-box domain-containing protein n=1 Tax=Glomus cerebriforme TaxID=658196 RepID=A0A397SC25_9GLOM|nr:hypothetical protein C1645_834415 [Glomus cerebriforme]